MTINDTSVVELLKKYKPKFRSDFKKLGLKLKFIGSGAFRNAYQIIDTNLVVKFPNDPEYYEDVEHSQDEIYHIRTINKNAKYKVLRPFIPKLHYANYKYGVIVMDKFQKVRYNDKAAVAVVNVLNEVMNAITGHKSGWYDLSIWNIGIDWDGAYKVLDLGLLGIE